MNPTSAVTAMLQARSVALVGASPRPGSFGERMVIEARRSSARMHLVNPRYQDIDGGMTRVEYNAYVRDAPGLSMTEVVRRQDRVARARPEVIVARTTERGR